MQLFLTSSAFPVAHDIAKRADLSKGKKLVFIDTAAEKLDEDKTWLKNDRESLASAGFELTDYTITGKTEDKLKKDLQGFDIVYLSGGDTSYLLEQSQKSGFVSVITDFVRLEGKTYIGTSAGSIIAGPIIPEYLTEDVEADESRQQKGFGLVNFTVVPHWGSKEFKEKYLSHRLKIAYEKHLLPLVLLRDNQYVHVQGRQMHIVSVDSKGRRP